MILEEEMVFTKVFTNVPRCTTDHESCVWFNKDMDAIGFPKDLFNCIHGGFGWVPMDVYVGLHYLDVKLRTPIVVNFTNPFTEIGTLWQYNNIQHHMDKYLLEVRKTTQYGCMREVHDWWEQVMDIIRLKLLIESLDLSLENFGNLRSNLILLEEASEASNFGMYRTHKTVTYRDRETRYNSMANTRFTFKKDDINS